MENVIVVFADYQTTLEDNEEFKELVHACDMNIIEIFQQPIKTIQLKTYIGKGKCFEIQEYIQEHPCDFIIFNQILSPLQVRNLEAILQTPILDRTDLILAIFEKRATTPTARLQIESAKLKKVLPLLIGSNTQLGRQSASGKNKGSGEKQLELDRRRIKARIHEVDRELKKIESQRQTQRKARCQSKLPLVSLVGYTNAGKSTIMNQLLRYSNHTNDKLVLEKDMLFATLDTSVRHIQLPFGQSFLLSDTVGFVNHLPHELIQAFHSTLEEVKYADLLLQIVDASDSEKESHIQVTNETLEKIGASNIPMITIYNKCDQSDYTYPKSASNHTYISAKEDTNIPFLLETIVEQLFQTQYHASLHIPYEDGALYSSLIQSCQILHCEHDDTGYCIEANLNEELYQKYKKYIIHLNI